MEASYIQIQQDWTGRFKVRIVCNFEFRNGAYFRKLVKGFDGCPIPKRVWEAYSSLKST